MRQAPRFASTFLAAWLPLAACVLQQKPDLLDEWLQTLIEQPDHDGSVEQLAQQHGAQIALMQLRLMRAFHQSCKAVLDEDEARPFDPEDDLYKMQGVGPYSVAMRYTNASGNITSCYCFQWANLDDARSSHGSDCVFEESEGVGDPPQIRARVGASVNTAAHEETHVVMQGASVKKPMALLLTSEDGCNAHIGHKSDSGIEATFTWLTGMQEVCSLVYVRITETLKKLIP